MGENVGEREISYESFCFWIWKFNIVILKKKKKERKKKPELNVTFTSLLY